MRCLITGATGNIGSLVVGRLRARGERPCVFVRDPKKARALFGDAVEIRRGDLAQVSLTEAALTGIDAVFLLNSGPDLAARDRAFAFAAKAAGVKHLVKLSTLDAATGVGTGPWHALGEDAVRESGIPFTFIRSAAFMSNVLGWAPAIRTRRVLRSSTGDGKIAFIHPDDLAEIITRALLTRDNSGASLVITGPEALSYGEMAAQIGLVIGASVRFEAISENEARRGAFAWAASREYAEALVDIWRAVRDGRMTTVTDGVERVLGRKPISFRRWAEENVDAFR